jgi:hypothetical protein
MRKIRSGNVCLDTTRCAHHDFLGSVSRAEANRKLCSWALSTAPDFTKSEMLPTRIEVDAGMNSGLQLQGSMAPNEGVLSKRRPRASLRVRQERSSGTVKGREKLSEENIWETWTDGLH